MLLRCCGRAGYDNPSAGQFRAAVECADQLHRRRSPQDHMELTQQLSTTKVHTPGFWMLHCL